MSRIRILFETPEDGVHSINRDTFHTEKRGIVTAFDNPGDASGLENKTHIPLQRVVRIDEKDGGH